MIGHCSICNRKKSLIIKDTTIAEEGIGYFLNSLGKKGLHASKEMTKIFLQKPARDFEIRANVGTAFASRSLEAIPSKLQELISFCHTGKRSFLLWKYV